MAVTVTAVANNSFASGTSKVLAEASTPVAGDIYVLVAWRGSTGADTSVAGLGATWTRELTTSLVASVQYLSMWVGRGATASGNVTYTHATAQTGHMALYRIRGLTQSLILHALSTDFTNTPVTGSSPETAWPTTFRVGEANTAMIASGAVYSTATANAADLVMTGGSATITSDLTYDAGASTKHVRYGYLIPTVGDTVQWSIDTAIAASLNRDMGVLLIGGSSQPHLNASHLGVLTSEPDASSERRLDLTMMEVLAERTTVSDKQLDLSMVEVMTDLAPPVRWIDTSMLEVLTDPVAAPAPTGKRGWGILI